MIVFVDPGHIGHNSVGASYGDTIERTINLDVAKRLIKLLEDKNC